jgi:hypothetical protein
MINTYIVIESVINTYIVIESMINTCGGIFIYDNPILHFLFSFVN